MGKHHSSQLNDCGWSIVLHHLKTKCLLFINKFLRSHNGETKRLGVFYRWTTNVWWERDLSLGSIIWGSTRMLDSYGHFSFKINWEYCLMDNKRLIRINCWWVMPECLIPTTLICPSWFKSFKNERKEWTVNKKRVAWDRSFEDSNRNAKFQRSTSFVFA